MSFAETSLRPNGTRLVSRSSARPWLSSLRRSLTVGCRPKPSKLPLGSGHPAEGKRTVNRLGSERRRGGISGRSRTVRAIFYFSFGTPHEELVSFARALATLTDSYMNAKVDPDAVASRYPRQPQRCPRTMPTVLYGSLRFERG